MQAVLKNDQYLRLYESKSLRSAIDNPDQFEQVFDTYYILEASEKIFMDDISLVRRSKMWVFGGYKAFISNFAYYNLY